ncbi:hypothetical protein GQ44DRAFT_730764 [Phaeosphaeriaceae sp. PMI808]|nr:hypothetical protein GQ44DRAFT_730764 [Phaeosphaeriaceae sp. PMI808]
MRSSKRFKTSDQSEVEIPSKQEDTQSPKHEPKILRHKRSTFSKSREKERGGSRVLFKGRLNETSTIKHSPYSPSSVGELAKTKQLETPQHDYSSLDIMSRIDTTLPNFSTEYLVGWTWRHGAPVMKSDAKYQQGLFWLCRYCSNAPSQASLFKNSTPLKRMGAGIHNDINKCEYFWSIDSGFCGAFVEHHLLKKHNICAPTDAAKPGPFELLNLDPRNHSHGHLVQKLGSEIAAVQRACKSGVLRWKEEKQEWYDGRSSKRFHQLLCKIAHATISYN